MSVNDGLFDELAPDLIATAEQAIRKAVRELLADATGSIHSSEKLSDNDRRSLLDVTAGFEAVN